MSTVTLTEICQSSQPLPEPLTQAYAVDSKIDEMRVLDPTIEKPDPAQWSVNGESNTFSEDLDRHPGSASSWGPKNEQASPDGSCKA